MIKNKIQIDKKNFFFLLVLGFIISFFFALPDLYVDYKTSNSLDPIRSFQPNNAHYLTVLNAAMNSGGPIPNPYLHEQQNIPSHYALMQIIIAHIPFVSSLSISLLWTLLRILVAVTYFILLYLMLRESGYDLFTAGVLSFCVVSIWGYIRFQSMALGNWYLPPMLLGMYLGSKAIKNGLTVKRRLILLSLALLLFSWHAVSFSLGGLAILLLWGYLIFTESKEFRKKTILMAFFWSIFSLFLFMILYAPFFLGQNNTAVSTLGRVVQFSSTYLMYHPIETIVVIVSVWVLLLTRRYSYVMFGIAALVGLNSNLVTGFYFANDHYVVLTEVLTVIAASSLWLNIDRRKSSKWLGLVALIAGLWYLYAGLSHLGFNPAYLGRYLVVSGSMFVITFLSFAPEPWRNFFSRYYKLVMVLIFLTSSLYVGALVYAGTAFPLKAQQEQKNIIPLINYLRKDDYSVVLANSKISNDIALYTKDRIYWSDLLFTDVINDKEILHRWLVSRVFFPNDEMANGELAVDTVYGAEIRCRHFRLFAEPLLGPFKNSFISRFREKDCPRIEAQRQTQKQFLDESLVNYLAEVKRNKFSPVYKLDLLVVADTDLSPKDILQRDFSFETKIGNFSIYRFKK